MSTTFYVPEAPVSEKDIPCDFPGCSPENRCGYCQDGVEHVRVSEAPEANFSETNASAVLSLLGFDTSDVTCLYGESDAASMRQRLIRARNRDRSSLVNEAFVIPGGHAGTRVIQGEDGLPTIQRMGPTTYIGATTDEQILRRLDSLEKVLIYAQEHGMKVAWG